MQGQSREEEAPSLEQQEFTRVGHYQQTLVRSYQQQIADRVSAQQRQHRRTRALQEMTPGRDW